jgi:hypothetical protein
VSIKTNACCAAKLDWLLDTFLNKFTLSVIPAEKSFFHKSSAVDGANEGWLLGCDVGLCEG